MTALDPEFLDMLRCPVCRGEVTEELEPHRLVCVKCGRRYRVTDGIPMMAPDLAEES